MMTYKVTVEMTAVKVVDMEVKVKNEEEIAGKIQKMVNERDASLYDWITGSEKVWIDTEVVEYWEDDDEL